MQSIMLYASPKPSKLAKIPTYPTRHQSRVQRRNLRTRMSKCWTRTRSMTHLTSLPLRMSQTSMKDLNRIWLSVRPSTSHYTRQGHHRFLDPQNRSNGRCRCPHLLNRRLKITINSPLHLRFLLCSHRTEVAMGQLAGDTSPMPLNLSTPLKHFRAPTDR